ncbi:protein serine/threonine kinase, putative [Entamoeba invadens IP1]|uniref:Protein serine/threonine kinase, putative n=1 Tax=Entamoeba invadens IP1 TaxID=370355 RepID=A0A0A1UCJ1_ENTIV|nr:protein serine/threonine kinase, putative [Entamoeba invadens IP1]ELP90009.1 protein serine/threonine kinase, putative [Entamoeba invadens IP1]|eukprot:XP_004256780.1 protein serine/threonine kinase, putative [Entamoeba invadens IP1]
MCESCSPTNKNCVTPVDGKCNNGLSLYNNYCYSCFNNFTDCVECDNVKWGCHRCAVGKTLSESRCKECDLPNCRTCSTSQYKCDICEESYYVENGECTKLCVDDDKCIQCRGQKCSKCQIGYTLDESSKCVQCTPTTCTSFSGECDVGYFPFDNYCWSTKEYFDGCLDASRYSTKCLSCKDGYGLSNDNSCKICEEGCSSCAFDNSLCVQCKEGFVYSNGKCYKQRFETCGTMNQITGCETCPNSNYTINGECETCSFKDCLTCSPYGCLYCQRDLLYDPTLSKCVEQTLPRCDLVERSQCFHCDDGYYVNSSLMCDECPANCETCIYVDEQVKCTSCIKITHYLKDDICVEKGNECVKSTLSGCLQCATGYSINNSTCLQCSENCQTCLSTGCETCLPNYLLVNNQCVKGDCQDSTNNICSFCNNGYYKTGKEPICNKCLDNCELCNTGETCSKCSVGYILVNNKQCLKKSPSVRLKAETTSLNNKCNVENEYGCLRCSEGYYATNSGCKPCQQNCSVCYNGVECMSCQMGFVLSNGNCGLLKDLEGCSVPFTDGTGCGLCKSGYVFKDKNCLKCHESCQTCSKDENGCLSCSDNYFMNESHCLPTTSIPNCILFGTHGCSICNNGYYVDLNGMCSKCRDNCTLCEALKKCTNCVNGFVLSHDLCISMTSFHKCIKAENGVCVECANGWFIQSGMCQELKKVWIYVVVSIAVLVFLLVVLFLLSVIALILFKKKKDMNKTVFFMKRANMVFFDLNSVIKVNTKEITFDKGCIPVTTSSRDLVCVGNGGKRAIKLQMSVVENERFCLTINPSVVVLKQGEACEFEILIKPNCTCKINSELKLVYVDLKTQKEANAQIHLKCVTELSTHIDPEELKTEIKLGEGSFGIVYLGKFREQKVAIKKMKSMNQYHHDIEEFEKEIEMLEKFKSDYIVHFYGAVFIPTKMCLVSEFAEHGSLRDLMNRQKEEEIPHLLKLKFLLDASKGIFYLHENNILHRDIKPDNILVISKSLGERINTKLTDFGSSRNINLLLTNMTFTKGIGTPKFMAPEVLNGENYRQPADVFSFAVTMYECFTWTESYTKDKFKFCWNVVDFVTKGSRLEQTTLISDEEYALIDKSWKPNPHDRLPIVSITNTLQSLYTSYIHYN